MTLKNRKTKEVFTGFMPTVSGASLKSMRKKIRELKLRRRTHVVNGCSDPRKAGAVAWAS
jgi:hypothetical protein